MKPDEATRAAAAELCQSIDAAPTDGNLYLLSKAILEAEQRGRRKGMEESAEVARSRELDDHPKLSPGSEMNAWWSGQEKAASDIESAIRAKLDGVQK